MNTEQSFFRRWYSIATKMIDKPMIINGKGSGAQNIILITNFVFATNILWNSLENYANIWLIASLISSTL